jgi:hypothetical protein
MDGVVRYETRFLNIDMQAYTRKLGASLSHKETAVIDTISPFQTIAVIHGRTYATRNRT